MTDSPENVIRDTHNACLNRIAELTAKVERYEAERRIGEHQCPYCQCVTDAALATDTEERFCVCGFSTTETLMPEHDHQHVVNEHQRGWAEHTEMCLAADTPSEDQGVDWLEVGPSSTIVVDEEADTPACTCGTSDRCARHGITWETPKRCPRCGSDDPERRAWVTVEYPDHTMRERCLGAYHGPDPIFNLGLTP